MDASNLGKWKLGTFLGEGSTGRVFEAASPERSGALKVLRPPQALHPEQVAQAWTAVEARLQRIADLACRSIVSLWDWGHEPADGWLWVAMERLHGDTLDRADPLAAPARLSTALAVARALAVAHAGDVLHGDLKPANIFVEDDGRVVLIDFALPFDRENTGAAMGSPMWLPPECIAGGPTSSASDVYSLGQCIAEFVTGEPAFALSGRGPARLMELYEQKQSRAFIDVGGEAGPLRDLVQSCTQREPSYRPRAADLVRELEGLVAAGLQ